MSTKFSRRNALKMGLGAGLGATTALYAPAVLSSDAPVIRYLGTAVNMGDEIEEKTFLKIQESKFSIFRKRLTKLQKVF